MTNTPKNLDLTLEEQEKILKKQEMFIKALGGAATTQDDILEIARQILEGKKQAEEEK